jgi:uncharacterized protein YjbI with pentapeptide repeats
MTDPIDRFLAATALMGPDSPDAPPDDLARRCGGIEALGQIGGEAAVRTLAAYVRANAPARIAAATPFDDRPKGAYPGGFGAARAGADWAARALAGPRLDVAAALAALGRLGGAPDLSGTCLQGARLAGAAWSGARLEGARLEGADLTGADLTCANLTRARLAAATLTGARLDGARLDGANLACVSGRGLGATEARMAGAVLSCAELTGSRLAGADLSGADLTAAFLDRSDLSGARLHLTILRSTFATGCSFRGAQFTAPLFDDDSEVHGSDYAGAGFRRMSLAHLGLSAAEIAAGFGDGSVTLPEGMARPAHWAAEVLDEAAWQAARGAGA